MPAGRLVIPANDIAQLVALFQAGAANVPAVAVGGAALGMLWVLYDQFNHNADIAPVLKVPNSMAGTVTPTPTPVSSTAAATSSACPEPSEQVKSP
jgi:hypothetical protein